MQEIEPYTKWVTPDGSRTLSVNSVGWIGDNRVAFGIAVSQGGSQPFEMTFDEIRADYEFVERF